MGKKVLVILGAAGVAAYIFRDRLIAAAMELVAKANQVSETVGAHLFATDETKDEESEHVR